MTGGARIYTLQEIAKQHERVGHPLIQAGYAAEGVERMNADGIPEDQQADVWWEAIQVARMQVAWDLVTKWAW